MSDLFVPYFIGKKLGFFFSTLLHVFISVSVVDWYCLVLCSCLFIHWNHQNYELYYNKQCPKTCIVPRRPWQTMLSASIDAGASLNVQGPETISQQTGSGLYSQYYKYLTGIFNSVLTWLKLFICMQIYRFQNFPKTDKQIDRDRQTDRQTDSSIDKCINK